MMQYHMHKQLGQEHGNKKIIGLTKNVSEKANEKWFKNGK